MSVCGWLKATRSGLLVTMAELTATPNSVSFLHTGTLSPVKVNFTDGKCTGLKDADQRE